MKFIFLFLISFSGYAQYIPVSTVDQCSAKEPKSKNVCESDSSEKCVKIDSKYNCSTYVSKEITSLDIDNPVYGERSDEESCESVNQCNEILLSKQCPEGLAPLTDDVSVYCASITYPVIGTGEYLAVEDSVKKASHLSSIAAKEQLQGAVTGIVSDMVFGRDLYAQARLLSISKGLDRAQRKLMRSELEAARDDLFDGDICSAKIEIAAIDTSLIPITDSEKQSFIDKIDSNYSCP